MKNFLLLTLTLWCFFAHAQLSQQFIRVHNVADLPTLFTLLLYETQATQLLIRF